MLGDTEAAKKCQNLKTRERAIPLLSLTNGCGSRTSRFVSPLLLLVSDIALFLALKIAGNGIRKVTQGRRGLSLLRDIGLPLSTAYLRQEPLSASMIRDRFRRGGRVQELQLPFVIPIEPLSASEEAEDAKSYMLYKRLDRANISASQDGQNTLP